MAFYGYDPMANVPSFAGYNQAAQQFGTAIQGVGQAIDAGIKNRETNTSLYTKSSAWMANIPDMPAELKVVPPPNRGESPESYQARITKHLHDSVVKYREIKKNDPNSAASLSAAARAVEDLFPREAEGMAQEAISKEYTPENVGKMVAGSIPQDQLVNIVQNVPSDAPRVIQSGELPGGERGIVTEPTETFNARQAGEVNRAIANKSDVGRRILQIVDGPGLLAKEKVDAINSLIKWDMSESRIEGQKKKAAEAKDLEGKRKNFAKLATAFKVIDRTTGKFVESGFDVNNPDAYFVSDIPVTKLPSVHITKREGGFSTKDLTTMLNTKKAYQAELGRMGTQGYLSTDPETAAQYRAIQDAIIELDGYIAQASGKQGYQIPEQPTGIGTGW